MNSNSVTTPIAAASHRTQETTAAPLAAAVSIRFTQTNSRRRTFGEKVRDSRLAAWLVTPDRSSRGFILRGLRGIQARVAFGLVVTGLIAAVATIIPTAAQAATASPAAASSAANIMGSYTPGDFSPYFPTSIRSVDNCKVELGPVYDSVPSPNYHKIGGVRVNCATSHSVIAATVWEMYWNGNSWVRYGSSNYGVRYNQYGSGTGLTGILRSPPVCFGTGNRGYWWITGALVQTERTGTYVYSDPHQDNSGC